MCVGIAAQEAPKTPPPPLPGEGPLAGEPVILDLTKPKSATPIVLDVIEVVGCVSQAPDKKWVVTNASNPLKSGASAQTVEALKAAETKALGKDRYVLIGASEWNPPSHNGEKVAVRGFVIKDVNENRLNVTSLNKVGDCK
jgi:hypothetical protein